MDWNEDQAIGERAMRDHAIERESAMKLAAARRALAESARFLAWYLDARGL